MRLPALATRATDYRPTSSEQVRYNNGSLGEYFFLRGETTPAILEEPNHVVTTFPSYIHLRFLTPLRTEKASRSILIRITPSALQIARESLAEYEPAKLPWTTIGKFPWNRTVGWTLLIMNTLI